MARHKNQNWSLPDGTLGAKGAMVHSHVDIQISLLMDIRDELQRLNATFDCHNAQAIPKILRLISGHVSRIPKAKP